LDTALHIEWRLADFDLAPVPDDCSPLKVTLIQIGNRQKDVIFVDRKAFTALNKEHRVAFLFHELGHTLFRNHGACTNDLREFNSLVLSEAFQLANRSKVLSSLPSVISGLKSYLWKFDNEGLVILPGVVTYSNRFGTSFSGVAENGGIPTFDSICFEQENVLSVMRYPVTHKWYRSTFKREDIIANKIPESYQCEKVARQMYIDSVLTTGKDFQYFENP
jgi:hypothetical protein